MSDLTRHHRTPKVHGGKSNANNISKVSLKQHSAWHTVFGTKSPQQIVDDLNNIWFYPEYEVILVKRDKTSPLNQLNLFDESEFYQIH